MIVGAAIIFAARIDEVSPVPFSISRLRRAGIRVLPLAMGTTAVVLIVVAIGYQAQRDYSRARYDPMLAPAVDNPGFRDTPQWRRLQAWAGNLHDANVAVVGPPAAFGQYVFYGSDLSNSVEYVGEPGPDGGYRPIESCASWRRAVNRLGGVGRLPQRPQSATPPGV
ncbi:MAG: hypothetical protein JJE35_07460 [Thermoleophilia bacterium]|nr:hypothetical protein [Thermoleophilia bacterium]